MTARTGTHDESVRNGGSPDEAYRSLQNTAKVEAMNFLAEATLEQAEHRSGVHVHVYLTEMRKQKV